ncbi:DUF4097 family beta strand repeat-containing protein [Puerhibacterium puerhi]|uniref:DUF4097 family beta strand repeat-containing protein n=1 Tax=Puerhibacterium puerhi TaxID=2692623 RepID=UPI0013588F0C|nr:DUF4097 family beta strand repeat-containing protein [Puerhibacterium puerhi]
MHTFDTPAPVSAVLDVPAGRVELVATDRADTTVEIRPVDASNRHDVKAAERTVVEHRDGTLRVTTPTKHDHLGPSGAVAVTVRLPSGSHLEARVAAADVRGSGRLGDVTVEAAQGTITLDEAASARLATLAGDVSVGRLGGAAQVSTAKGDITVAEAVRGALTLTTQAGDVSVGAAPGVSASLDAGTGYGRVSNALVNAGTVELEIRATTAYGDISARSL